MRRQHCCSQAACMQRGSCGCALCGRLAAAVQAASQQVCSDRVSCSQLQTHLPRLALFDILQDGVVVSSTVCSPSAQGAHPQQQRFSERCALPAQPLEQGSCHCICTLLSIASRAATADWEQGALQERQRTERPLATAVGGQLRALPAQPLNKSPATAHHSSSEKRAMPTQAWHCVSAGSGA